MRLYLGHISGLEYWTCAALGKLPAAGPLRTRGLAQCAVSAREIKAFDCARLGVGTLPLDVLVPATAPNTPLKRATRWRVQEPLPAGSLFSAGDAGGDIAVCSPELCFAQLAARLSMTDLLLLGYELCGKYALCPWAEGGFVGRPPLTSAAKLRRSADRLDGCAGAKRARLAAQSVLDGAESPMESKLAIQLGAPTRIGGFGFGGMLLNAEIAVPSKAPGGRSVAKRRCDLLWKEDRLALEYDSATYHDGAGNIDRDARRRNQLIGSNLTVITVTKQQAYSLDSMEELARLIAKKRGDRLRVRRRDFAEKRRQLHAELFKPDSLLLRPAIPRYDLPFWS